MRAPCGEATKVIAWAPKALMYGWCLAGSACLLKARPGAWEVFREQDTRSTVTGSIYGDNMWRINGT